MADRLIQADLELIGAQAKLETARRTRKPVEARPGDPAGTPRPPAIAGSSSTTSEEKLRELEDAVEEVKRKRIGYMQYLENVKVQTKVKHSDALITTMVNQELASLLKMQDLIVQKLEQLNFETKQDVYRITLHDRAGVPKVPLNNQRIVYMAAVPFVVLFLILAMFLTQEIKAARDTTSAGAST